MFVSFLYLKGIVEENKYGRFLLLIVQVWEMGVRYFGVTFTLLYPEVS
jgi:hypothetical protein